MKYELLIFDWDGTLMNSLAQIVSSVQEVAKTFGYAAPTVADVHETIGLNLLEIFKRLYPEASSEVHETMLHQYVENIKKYDFTDDCFYPGVKETLKKLYEVGYTLAIATGKNREDLDKVMKNTGIHSWFTTTRTANETQSKPSPVMLYSILNETGITPSKSLMIGDSIFDMAMALNAGVDSIAVTCGTQSEQTLMKYSPRACLGSIAELPDWLVSNSNT